VLKKLKNVSNNQIVEKVFGFYTTKKKFIDNLHIFFFASFLSFLVLLALLGITSALIINRAGEQRQGNLSNNGHANQIHGPSNKSHSSEEDMDRRISGNAPNKTHGHKGGHSNKTNSSKVDNHSRINGNGTIHQNEHGTNKTRGPKPTAVRKISTAELMEMEPFTRMNMQLIKL
jgi:hypothetical protein